MNLKGHEAGRWIVFVLCCIGVFLTTVLTAQKVFNLWLPCTAGYADCNSIQASAASSIAGIPISFLGLMAYLGLLILSWPRPTPLSGRLLSVSMALSGLAGSLSFGLILYATRYLGIACIWCISSAVCFNLIFLILCILWASSAPSTLHKRPPRLLPPALLLLTLCGASLTLASIRLKYDSMRPDRALIERSSYDLIAGNEHFRIGHPTPEFTVVVFGSTRCGGCRYIMMHLIRSAQHNSNIALIYRHRPLNNNDIPIEAAIEMLPDANSKWQFMLRLYEAELTQASFQDALRGAGLSPQEWEKRCRDWSDPAIQRVISDAKAADELGIRGTPTIVLIDSSQNKRLVSPPELLNFLELIEKDRKAEL